MARARRPSPEHTTPAKLGPPVPASGDTYEKTGGASLSMHASGDAIRVEIPRSWGDRFAWRKAVRDDKRVPPLDKLLAHTLETHMNQSGWCFVKLPTLADEMGCARSTVAERIKDSAPLIAYGYIEVGSYMPPKAKSGRPVNTYTARTPKAAPPVNRSATPSQPADTPHGNKVRHADVEHPAPGLLNVREPDWNRPSNKPNNRPVRAQPAEHRKDGARLDRESDPLDSDLEQDLIEHLRWAKNELGADDQFVATILDTFWFGRNGHMEWRGGLTLTLIEKALSKAFIAEENPPGFFFYCLRDHFMGYGL